MAKTQDLKRRIRSVKNTMQLTRAMKMVSAAKLRRSQDRMSNARPYARQTMDLLRSLANRADPDDHPLLKVGDTKRVELIVLTGDRGLCGSFNINICRRAEEMIRNHPDREVSITAVGKKGREYFSHRGYRIGEQWIDVLRTVEFPLAVQIADKVMNRFLNDEVDEIYLVYNEFKSAIQARPVVEKLLPVERAEMDGDGGEDYIYEPEAQEILKTLLPHYVKILVFQSLLESVAAEHAARMTAMDSATSNAGELIESLTLTMNRVRQASITTEIIEVVSGAEALG